MDERRKHKRLDLDVSVQLERLDQDDYFKIYSCGSY